MALSVGDAVRLRQAVGAIAAGTEGEVTQLFPKNAEVEWRFNKDCKAIAKKRTVVPRNLLDDATCKGWSKAAEEAEGATTASQWAVGNRVRLKQTVGKIKKGSEGEIKQLIGSAAEVEWRFAPQCKAREPIKTPVPVKELGQPRCKGWEK
jgi:hypothetical protein